jgi:hypothetical protein
LVPPVLLGARGAPDLAARRCGNRPRRYQNEITDIQAVRIGYRGGDVALDVTEPACGVLVAVLALLELDDGDQLLGTVYRNRYRRDPAACDLLDRRLDVLGIVIATTNDKHVLDAADNE